MSERLLYAFLLALCGAPVSIFLKRMVLATGTEPSMGTFVRAVTNLNFYGAVIMGVISVLLYCYIISKIELSTFVPMFYGLSMCLIALFGIVLLGEQVTIQKLVGIVASVLGVVLLTL